MGQLEKIVKSKSCEHLLKQNFCYNYRRQNLLTTGDWDGYFLVQIFIYPSKHLTLRNPDFSRKFPGAVGFVVHGLLVFPASLYEKFDNCKPAKLRALQSAFLYHTTRPPNTDVLCLHPAGGTPTLGTFQGSWAPHGTREG